MSLLKVLKISESWNDAEEFAEEGYEQLEQELNSCMSWLQDYFQTRNKSLALSFSEKEALQKIKYNYSRTVRVLEDKKHMLRSELNGIRKGKQSEQLYNQVANL